MSFKSIVKAVTPPIIWSALRAARPAPSSSHDIVREDHILLGYALSLQRRFPELLEYGLNPSAQTAEAIVDFYAEVLPLTYLPARGAHIRNALFRLGEDCKAPDVLRSIEREIAKTELLNNTCPDRAAALSRDPAFSAQYFAELEKMEAAYGAPVVSQAWPGLDRGETLIYFFEAHPHFLDRKTVLHFAPEPNLRDWIIKKSGVSNYRSSNAYSGDADETQDITAITLPENSFDVVICHRVMEHVLDDDRAFSELYRVLKPGGFVSFSVPQAPHRPETSEWAIPDLTHHHHVRHYGADLEDRARSAGFAVTLEKWLLEQPREALLARKAYPMRIFHLHKTT